MLFDGFMRFPRLMNYDRLACLIQDLTFEIPLFDTRRDVTSSVRIALGGTFPQCKRHVQCFHWWIGPGQDITR
jgi:hypothetical protein